VTIAADGSAAAYLHLQEPRSAKRRVMMDSEGAVHDSEVLHYEDEGDRASANGSPSRAKQDALSKQAFVEERFSAPLGLMRHVNATPHGAGTCVPTQCSDEPTADMKSNPVWSIGGTGQCSDMNEHFKETRCNKHSWWIEKKICQQTCFDLGLGYAGDTCCCPCSDKPSDEMMKDANAWSKGGSGKCSDMKDWHKTNFCNKKQDWIDNEACMATCFESGSGYASTRPNKVTQACCRVSAPAPPPAASQTSVDGVILNPSETLRQAAASKREFYMGAGALKYQLLQVNDPRYRTLAKEQYNAGTAGNDCKYGVIQEEEGVYNYTRCDIVRDFVVNEMNGTFRCHALAWGNQNKPWLYDLTNTSKKINLIKSVQHMVSHYGTDCWAWDVVNEAIEDGNDNRPSQPLTAASREKYLKTNGSPGGVDIRGFRQHPWYPYVSDYVDETFLEARKACPTCKLFYNDFDAEGWGHKSKFRTKSDKVYEFVRGLQKREIPIDGVGLQVHVTLDKEDRPHVAGIRENIERLAALGLEVHLTEVDIKVPPPWSTDKELKQARLYAELLHACWAVKGCTAFYTWGFTDKSSWLTDWGPQSGNNVAPLPFDTDYRPKLAVPYMIHVLKGFGITWTSVDS
jgi:endo-1,4-beta-xylanase